ncbi:L-asparaginase (plasmid) [Azoarcus sp. KH32C]|nr:L-asparaginase [Azoarcus sp. KH32C]
MPVIAIHGGAGGRGPGEFDPDIEAAYRDALANVLRSGRQVLADGGSALDAVSLAVDLLEDCPLFNAGRGAVFTRDETHELDAAVMDGATLRAGAVACVSRVGRPLRAARAVMERSTHVLLVGAGAEAFAEACGLELVEPDYFSTELRREQLRRAQSGLLDDKRKHGTVGAVALDARGHLAAATSTGGVTNKLPGRVGDSPLIGAGTYANRVAAVSCTGTGEYFIRCAVAHDLCARIAYGGLTLEAAAQHVVMEALSAIGGQGGLIAVDAHGNVSMPFNTEGMYRGYMRVDDAAPWTAIYP